MAKFYNEIVIDMNPESSTFEETLFEDSYEYEGDIMHLYEENPHPKGSPEYATWEYTNYPVGQTGQITKDLLSGLSEQEAIEKIAEVKYGWKRHTGISNVGKTWDQMREELYDEYGEMFTPEEYGAADIGKDDFVDPTTGDPYDYQTVVNNLIAKFPDKDPEDIRQQVKDNMPKYQGIDEEAKDYIQDEYEIAAEDIESQYGESGTAKMTRDLALQKSKDVYELGMGTAGRTREAGLETLRGGAGKIGAASRSAYGGQGVRGGRAAQTSLAKGLEKTYDVYGAETKRLEKEKGYGETAYDIALKRDTRAGISAMERAELAKERGIYGLEQEAEGKFDTQLGSFIGGWAKEGGRVPSKKTFLDLLTSLPDAGGS